MKSEINYGGSSFQFDDQLGLGKLCHLVPFVHISDINLQVRDLWEAGSWNFDKIFSWLHDDVKCQLCNIFGSNGSLRSDGWSWDEGDKGVITASLAYKWLIHRHRSLPSSGSWMWVQRLPVPKKIKLLVWFILHKALPTGFPALPSWSCSLFGLSRCVCLAEDTLHCMRDCQLAMQVVYSWLVSMDLVLAFEYYFG